ncbi:amidohydrolase family protein, partial [Rhizobium brockwellii]|uniref:amidohydrolase family protein n=1 Tax=Rhizobium brockwellii TaxID=3019932 RepID=UPI003F9CCA9D
FQRVQPFAEQLLESYYLITLGNAEALSLADRSGTLEPGTEADLVVLDATATRAMALKMEVVKTLSEELFLLQSMCVDLSIAESYVAGVAL